MVGLLTGATSTTVNPSTAVDRITKLLTDQKPSLDEFFNSAIEASTGKTTFGEQLNASRANSIAEAQSLYDVLSKERSAELDQRKYALEVQKAEAAAEQEAAQAGRETFGDFITSFKDMYAGADPKRQFEAYQYLNTLGVDENSSPKELRAALNDVAANFGFVPPPKEPKPGFTLSPGQTRYDEKGNPIAAVPAAEPKPTLRDAKIQDYIAQGLSYDDAAAAADGNVVTGTDPVTGAPVLVNRVTGAVIQTQQPGAPAAGGEQAGAPVAQPGIPAESGAPSTGMTAFEAAGHGTGLISSLLAAYNNTLANIGAPLAKGTSTARTAFNAIGRQIVSALALNPKFPVAEVQFIQDSLGLESRAFLSPQDAQQKIVTVAKFLEGSLANAERDARDPHLPADYRKDQAAKAATLRNIIPMLGATSSPNQSLPEGIPTGSALIGRTQDGFDVYQTPDGQKLVVE